MNHRRLVIDMGNTRQKMGLFEGDELKHSENMLPGQSTSELWDSWKMFNKPDQIGLSSTVELSDSQQVWIKRNNVIQINADLNFPFEIRYTTPQTLGQDRLAAVSAVYTLYSGKNVLVMDCGTCLTYDFLTSDGVYLGGNIAPGVRMRLQAMHHYTDRLPLVELPEQVTLLGQSTEEALQSGALGMAIMEAEGFIFYLKEKYGHLTTVLTGGDVRYFENQLSVAYEVHSDLILSGLNEILKNNEI